MEHILYWLWLTTKYGVTPSKIKVLLEYFKTVEEIYFSKNFNNIYGLSDKIKSSLADKDLSKAEKILEQTAKLNQKILGYDSESYPQILKNISSPPYVLYIQGKVLELDKVLTIGVVGTRNSSEYGRVVTDRICRELAQYGAVTVGGLARGIDTVGAWATLDVGGVAVGVVGSGLDIVYPSENVELVKAITEKGCILSEYAPGTPPVRNHFPARNRIIAGLSRGILVTEAPEKSGALITAATALDQGREVFAVPGAIDARTSLGCNALLRDGAGLAAQSSDILGGYYLRFPHKLHPRGDRPPLAEPPAGPEDTPRREKPVQDKPRPPQSAAPALPRRSGRDLSDLELSLLRILDDKIPLLIDEAADRLQLPVAQVLSAVTIMEIDGLIRREGMRKYLRTVEVEETKE